MTNKLNIFTLNWNGADKLQKLKDSMLPSLENLNWKWVIRDNKSNDNSIDLIKSWNHSNIELITYSNNQESFSAGMNYIHNVSGTKDDDYVLLLNNDVIFNDHKSVKNMIQLMEKDPDVGIVGARLLFTGTNLLQHCGVVWKNHGPYHYRSKEQSDKNAEKDREFQAVTAAVMLTKSKYFPMDPNYFWSFCDIDYCMNVKYNYKKKIVYCGRTNFFHEESASLKKNPVNKLFMNQNLNRLNQKWGNVIKIDDKDYYKDFKHNLYCKK